MLRFKVQSHGFVSAGPSGGVDGAVEGAVEGCLHFDQITGRFHLQEAVEVWDKAGGSVPHVFVSKGSDCTSNNDHTVGKNNLVQGWSSSNCVY